MQASYNNVIKYYGELNTPQDILRRRKQSLETMKRLGTPVLIKKMYTVDDVEKGIATESPNFATAYGQSTHDDEISYGVGYCSVETQPGEWIDNEGQLQVTDSPQTGWEPAPKYRGYGPGYLTYCILPDAAEDVFRPTPEGLLLHTQIARTQLPWWPLCHDNDLLIVCELDAQQNIIATQERYQLHQVQPITMRGLDRWGQREFKANAAGNRFWIGQYCEANKVYAETDPIYAVEVDR